MLPRWATCTLLLLMLLAAALTAYQLANGLRVILAPESGATLLLAVSYAGGLAADPPAYPGLAHLAEHVTFRGSRHVRAFEGPKLLEALGGGWTAVTLREQLVLSAKPNQSTLVEA